MGTEFLGPQKTGKVVPRPNSNKKLMGTVVPRPIQFMVPSSCTLERHTSTAN
jgi:hypothetical protein